MHQQNQQASCGLATAAEAVAFLRLSRTTLWRLARTGHLAPVRIGRAVRYRWLDLRRLAGEGGAK
ncbi:MULTISPECIES: helix-turn-helix domain-containing protein [unclassified Thiomonas]|uniref:helix-turn-helix domain-containing protein n=1 Tax=unclassified Thiomonas TaxID=2625466 RepID=UPI0004DBBAD9|nr:MULTISPECIES: helix-turn-helix domain-containing protein [unclassified Thiomonas]CDW96343.1 conserved hypothetical protein [Thiomonas sp. CB2]VDY06729.1 conserved protein of unknown function [Thiomonas sp. Bio17B3]VDY09977.1 conserved protein of unknown function [Thiomonas sp. Sup16B3]VDY11219.1 conserved protein of unknown function [Thiomonas sp. Sup16B3]VDY11242.1 conserved protein of unknown function [Thiomonas sp. Bio17B3]